MVENDGGPAAAFHDHVFLGEGHEKSERKTWAVIWLCGVMMVVEILPADDTTKNARRIPRVSLNDEWNNIRSERIAWCAAVPLEADSEVGIAGRGESVRERVCANPG